MDASGNPNKDGFQEFISLMSHVVSKSVVQERRVRFGAITFSDSPRLEFTLKQFNSQADVLRVLSNLKPSGLEERNTAQALNYTLSYFGETHGGRRAKNVPQVLFLITDGPVNDLSGLEAWRESLALSEVNFFAIGAEDADEVQLREMAGERGRVHYASTYQDLRGLQKLITQELCNLTKPSKCLVLSPSDSVLELLSCFQNPVDSLLFSCSLTSTPVTYDLDFILLCYIKS